MNRSALWALPELRQQMPSEWPWPWRLVLGVFVALVALLLAGWQLDTLALCLPQRAQAERRAQLAQEQAQMTQALTEWRTQVQRWREQPAPSLAQALQPLRESASEPSLWLEAPQHAAQVTHWPLQVQWQGRLADFQAWWTRVEQLALPTQLLALQIDARTPAAAGASAPLQVSVRLRLSGVPDPSADDLPTEATDPFDLRGWQQHHWQRARASAGFESVAERWGHAPSALTRSPVSDLRYLGRLQSGAHEVALVQTPGRVEAPVADATLWLLRPGDAMGAGLGRLTRIEDERLLVTQWQRDDSGVWRAQVLTLELDRPRPGPGETRR